MKTLTRSLFARSRGLLALLVLPALLLLPGAKPVTSADLGGTDRFQTFLSTDKPIYREGDTIYFRAVTLDAFDKKPLTDRTRASLTIKDSKGATLYQASAEVSDATAGFSWKVPPGQAGGEYKAEVQLPTIGAPPARRTFDIRAYRPPRLNTQITFMRKGYGPGQTVSANCTISRAEGGIPVGAPVTLLARVDGAEVYRGQTKVTPEGRAVASFDLPDEIERGEGSLSFLIEDGGVVETATKSLPILLRSVDVSLFPEGGDLVAGLDNRVYFEARLPTGKPADIRGVILGPDGGQVGTFASEHEGRGRFALTPGTSKDAQKAGAYKLRIYEPEGIESTIDLPASKPAGVVIRSQRDAFDEMVKLEISGRNIFRPLTLTITQREKEIVRRRFSPESLPVKISTGVRAEGVVIATVWEGEGDVKLPIAERLLFRRPTKSVKVSIDSKPQYLPGGKVVLDLVTTDEVGNPTAAVVGLAVTDKSVREMIETREQPPRLPVMVHLEKDVRELADAHIYLDPENPKAERALDLLLGTQGWRRFALLNSTDFLREHGHKARDLLAVKMVTRDEMVRTSWMMAPPRPAAPAAPMALAAAPAEMMLQMAEGERVAPKKSAVKRKGFAVRDKAAAAPPAAAEKAVAPPKPPVAAAKPRPVRPPVPRANREVLQAQQQGKALGGAFFDAKRPAPSIAAGPMVREELAEAFERADADAQDEFFLKREDVVASILVAYVVVREYAHPAPSASRPPEARTDFTETVYWSAATKTDTDGKARVTFHLNDSVTRFQVDADVFDDRGALGAAKTELISVKPFYVEAKMPLEITQGDEAILPVTFVNNGTDALTGATLTVDGSTLPAFVLDAGERKRQLLPLTIGGDPGSWPVTFNARAGSERESLTRSLKVVPRGFPAALQHGGTVSAENAFRHEITLPDTLVDGSVVARVDCFTSPLANLQDSLKGLIRQPNGCFEQTSSSTFPLIMAQQYFMSHPDVDPDLVRRSEENLAKGYKRLTGYECKQGGFEWFGADPGHEALTAYGLLEFTEMSRVRQVDGAMIDRTREWLLDRRDGKGGFKRERRALHTWIEDRDCSDAYITWALLESGEPPRILEKEIDHVLARGTATDNAYVTALAALIAASAGRDAEAADLREKLADVAKRGQGVTSIETATASIVGSRGTGLHVEATALAALAWLQDPAQRGLAKEAVAWLNQKNSGGRFGTTQGTILALKAIVEFDRTSSRIERPGELALHIDGQPIGKSIAFDKDTQEILNFDIPAQHLTAGKHTIELQMTDGSSLPAALEIAFHDEQPHSSADCALALRADLRDAKLPEGEVTEIDVRITNQTADAVPSPMAIIGLPGGLEPDHDQLKELVKAGTLAAYEVNGRDVVCYRRDLRANAEWRFPIRCVAAVPGTYTAPASRAYLYYDDTLKTWQSPLTVDIAAK